MTVDYSGCNCCNFVHLSLYTSFQELGKFRVYYNYHGILAPSILSGNKLILDDLGQVMEEVLDVSAQWYHLGLQLKVRIGTLDSIQAQFLDPKRQLLEMLKVWLTTSDNTSWKTLKNALRSRSVGASQLAGVLEAKYCLVQPKEVDSGSSTSDCQPETNITPPPPPVSEQMVPQPGVADAQASKRICD